MFRFNLKPRFTRKYRKLIKRNRDLGIDIDSVLDRLAADPRDPSLDSHKVIAWDGKPAFSIEVTGDLRITWRYSRTEENTLELVDIGGHSGSRKVYR